MGQIKVPLLSSNEEPVEEPYVVLMNDIITSSYKDQHSLMVVSLLLECGGSSGKVMPDY